MKDAIVTGIPFAGTEISPSPSPIMCETSPLPLSSTTSSDNISLPSSPTHQECATTGVPDQISESCEENSDEINTTSSSLEDRSAGQADVVLCSQVKSLLQEMLQHLGRSTQDIKWCLTTLT